MEIPAELPDFYRGRSVLLTGGTGFIGKALVEKLLRCCPEVERLYLLVRRKQGLDPQKRIDDLLALPLFAGCARDKVTAVAGDIALPGLGLSDEDRELVVTHVSVVLHSAATVTFTEPLRVSVPINTESVHHVLRLARDMKQLVAVVHLSTAYSNCNRAAIDEEVYPAPADVRDVLRTVKEEDDETLERMTPQLLGDRPNTYAFTKALAESIVADEGADLPVAIVRPSIVGWAWRDPSPGYTDNGNGVIGPLLMIGLGAVRTAICRLDKVADVVPVDLVVNTILAVVWRTAAERPPLATATEPAGAAPRAPAPPPVYNVVTGPHNSVKWGYMVALWIKLVRRSPAASALWWPNCIVTTSPMAYRVHKFFTMLLPAAIHDLFAPLLGKSPTLLRKQRKLLRLMEALEFFTTNEWDFKDDNVRAVWERLSARDRILFPMNVEAVDWDSYLKEALEGSKRHLLKEEKGVSGNPLRLYLLHILAQTVIWTSLGSLVGWAFWPQISTFYPSRTVNFVNFLRSKYRQ